MSKKLRHNFFERPTLKVASDLLGKYLIRNYRGKKIIGEITETEAYIGENDLASHASRGRTARTKIMYGKAGHAYIYLVYGMHYMFNIVTEKKDFPAAILIRALKIDDKLINGPGKLSQFMKIDKNLNNEDLVTSKKLWLENHSTPFRVKSIKKTPRIGVDYAGVWRRKPWRFTL
jgi:DNA-3-methyladenine glycosylase